MSSCIKCLGVTRLQMLKGQREETDEDRSETLVKTYGVHLVGMRLPGSVATFPALWKAGRRHGAICCLVRRVPETGGADLTRSFSLAELWKSCTQHPCGPKTHQEETQERAEVDHAWHESRKGTRRQAQSERIKHILIHQCYIDM